MAKYEPRPDLDLIKGDFYEIQFTGVDRGGLDVLLSRNQHALLYMAKPFPTKKRTKIQAMMRDRFAQLECMWKMMTPLQRMKMRDYNTELNVKDTRNLSPIQRFRSLGLHWALDHFIHRKLQPDYKLELVEETAKELVFKITLDIKLLDEFIVQPLRNVH